MKYVCKICGWVYDPAENNGVAFDEIAEEASVDKAVKVDDEEFKTTPGSEFGHACFIIRTHFGVIIMRSVSRAVGLHKSRLSWIGSRLNINIAKHVYHILIRESRRAFREASKATIIGWKFLSHQVKNFCSTKTIPSGYFTRTAFVYIRRNVGASRWSSTARSMPIY